MNDHYKSGGDNLLVAAAVPSGKRTIEAGYEIDQVCRYVHDLELQPILCKIRVLNFKTSLFRELECYKLT